jgi:hypothetical protein
LIVDENPEHHSSPSDCLRRHWATVMPKSERQLWFEMRWKLRTIVKTIFRRRC